MDLNKNFLWIYHNLRIFYWLSNWLSFNNPWIIYGLSMIYGLTIEYLYFYPWISVLEFSIECCLLYVLIVNGLSKGFLLIFYWLTKDFLWFKLGLSVDFLTIVYMSINQSLNLLPRYHPLSLIKIEIRLIDVINKINYFHRSS